MLDLDSRQWDALSASCGGTGRFTAQLLRQIYDGDLTAYEELVHQVCHQFTVGEVAYAAVPHLVQLARRAERSARVAPLGIVGMVETARQVNHISSHRLPDVWRDEYLAANQEALQLAAECLQQPGWPLSDSLELLATVAALQGHWNLAMHVFLNPAEQLSCPDCGVLIDFREGGPSQK